MSHNDDDSVGEYPDQLPYPPELPEITTELLDVSIPRRKTGVIVGLDSRANAHQVDKLGRSLAKRFPDVTLVVVAGAQSVAFEWEVDE